jgi:hypothetical protein
METYRAWCELFRELPTAAAKHGYDFSQDEADLICHKNAIRVFGLQLAASKPDANER